MSRWSPPQILTLRQHRRRSDRARGSAATRTSAKPSAAANITGRRGKNDWQMSLERAFNSLDQKGGLFQLDPRRRVRRGRRFPRAAARSPEVRYEGIAHVEPAAHLQPRPAGRGGRAKSRKLDRVDDDQPARKFFRPKGSVTLGWRPAEELGRQPQAAPPRRADQLLRFPRPAEAEQGPRECRQSRPRAAAELGGRRPRSPTTSAAGARPGSNLRITGSRTSSTSSRSANDGQGIGNLPRADRYGFESTSTIQFDPIGWTGAKLDLNARPRMDLGHAIR